jgi:hypothetical protein
MGNLEGIDLRINNYAMSRGRSGEVYTNITTGSFVSEVESQDYLERCLLKNSRYFSWQREVTGYYIQPRPHCKPQTPRIDFILKPTEELVNQGWEHGCIGVECKKSGEKIGPAVTQILDYHGSVFKLDPSGTTVMLEWIFIWPLQTVIGDMASVMNRNRIGWICEGFATPSSLEFKVAGRQGLYLQGPQELPSVNNFKCGYKLGSQ